MLRTATAAMRAFWPWVLGSTVALHALDAALARAVHPRLVDAWPDAWPYAEHREILAQLIWIIASMFLLQPVQFLVPVMAVLLHVRGASGRDLPAAVAQRAPVVAVPYGLCALLSWAGYQLILPGLALAFTLAYVPVAVADRVDGTLGVRCLRPLGRSPGATAGVVVGLALLATLATLGVQVAIDGSKVLVGASRTTLSVWTDVTGLFTQSMPWVGIHALLAAIYLEPSPTPRAEAVARPAPDPGNPYSAP